MASVQETKQSWSEEEDLQLEKPKLDVQVSCVSRRKTGVAWLALTCCCPFTTDSLQIRGNPQVGQDCYVTFSFMNPLPVNLSECEFTYEGAGLIRPQTVKFR